jgi:hypothetical protein
MANLFWTDARLEPKRGYRFLVTLGNMPGGATYYVKSVTKPGLKISAKEHMYLGHKFHYPGLVTWDPNPITIKLIDPVNPDASQHLASIIAASGYVIPKNSSHVTTIAKGSSVGALGTVIIKQITESHGPQGQNGGTAVESWTLNNAFIEAVKFGDLDYSKEDLSEIELQIRYDWCTLETLNPVTNTRVITDLVSNTVDTDLNTRFKG